MASNDETDVIEARSFSRLARASVALLSPRKGHARQWGSLLLSSISYPPTKHKTDIPSSRLYI